MRNPRTLLAEAAAELRRLRQSNEVLRAQVRVVDIFALALQGRWGGEAVAPSIEFEIEQMLAEKNRSTADATAICQFCSQPIRRLPAPGGGWYWEHEASGLYDHQASPSQPVAAEDQPGEVAP